MKGVFPADLKKTDQELCGDEDVWGGAVLLKHIVDSELKPR